MKNSTTSFMEAQEKLQDQKDYLAANLTEISACFHRLWTAAAEGPKYSKDEWTRFQNMLDRAGITL